MPPTAHCSLASHDAFTYALDPGFARWRTVRTPPWRSSQASGSELFTKCVKLQQQILTPQLLVCVRN